VQGEVVLTSFIEVGIGIAGFSSIVVALSRSTISEDMKVAFLQIWIQSGAIIIFSAVPLLLEATRLDRELLYVISSYLYGTFLLVVIVFGPIRKRFRAHPILLVTLLFPITVLFNAIYLGQAWPYLSVLLAGIFIAFLSFYQLIRDMWSRESDA
jgi:4-hydroxybenzoate polyprenyltransferase